MDRGCRGLPDTTSGRLEDRGGRVVRTVQVLKAGRKSKKKERRKNIEKNIERNVSSDRTREWKGRELEEIFRA